MKTITTTLFLLLALIFSSCQSSGVQIPDSSIASATIIIDKSVDDIKEIKLYLDYKDANITLYQGEENRIYLEKEKTNIQIVQKYKTASIDFDVIEEKEYRFKLLKTYDNNLIIVQIENKL